MYVFSLCLLAYQFIGIVVLAICNTFNPHVKALLNQDAGLSQTLGYIIIWPYIIYLGFRSWCRANLKKIKVLPIIIRFDYKAFLFYLDIVPYRFKNYSYYTFKLETGFQKKDKYSKHVRIEFGVSF